MITTEEEFEKWLSEQTRTTRMAIAWRAAMRVLPLAITPETTGAEDLRVALAACRACLTAGVAVTRAIDQDLVTTVAASAGLREADEAATSAAIKATNLPSLHPKAALRVAGYALLSALDSRLPRPGKRGARLIFNLSLAEATEAEADQKARAYAEVDLKFGELIFGLNSPLVALSQTLAERRVTRIDLFSEEGPWTFWAKWHARAMAGDPLPWDLQEKVALIPNEIWEAGPEAVAEEIARIEAEFIADEARLLETLVLDPSVPVYSAKRVASSNPDRIAMHLARVDDALDDLVALGGNNGLTEATAEYRIIKRLVRKYDKNPERIAFDLTDVNRSISRQFESGEYPKSEPFVLLQAAATACISTICDMEPEVAAELQRAYPREPAVPDAEDVDVVAEAMVMSLDVLDQPAAETTKEDFAELFRNRIIDAAEEDPFHGPARVAREYRAVVLRRQISRLAQIARDYAHVDKLAEHYDSKYSKAAGVVMRYGGVAGALWAAVRVLGYMLGVV